MFRKNSLSFFDIWYRLISLLPDRFFGHVHLFFMVCTEVNLRYGVSYNNYSVNNTSVFVHEYFESHSFSH